MNIIEDCGLCKGCGQMTFPSPVAGEADRLHQCNWCDGKGKRYVYPLPAGTKVTCTNRNSPLHRQVVTINQYNDNLCGDGCCEGYSVVEGDPNIYYWPSELVPTEKL